ncbi:alanine racemase [Actinomyces vulturis]|uniref:alanine racemase n=1 Tax=Actinomyces vulturis TaxID=1857645 RepID=UPI0008340E98|nr:alanine racemase [Actinomyces vulturis]
MTLVSVSENQPQAPSGTPSTTPTPPWSPQQSARAVIDLDAIAANGRSIADQAQTPWMAIIKANAYGHGTAEVGRAALNAGATWLGLAHVHEALDVLTELAGPDSTSSDLGAHLFAWMMPPQSDAEVQEPTSLLRQAIRRGIDLSVSTPAVLRSVELAFDAEHRDNPSASPARIHLKIDTGMTRAGAREEDFAELCDLACQARERGTVEVVGLWSHLARADEPDKPATDEQIAVFERAEHMMRSAGLPPQVRHLAATSGALFHPRARFDLVRLGIGLYGLSPDANLASSADLELTPAMTLQARLLQVKKIPQGRAVSYGGIWAAPTDRWLGLVPIGYADGIDRLASWNGSDSEHVSVSVHSASGRIEAPLVGRVCMDQFMVDLGPVTSDEPPAQIGDTVTLWGSHISDPLVDDWARVCRTINYELISALGERIPRVYIGVTTM